MTSVRVMEGNIGTESMKTRETKERLDLSTGTSQQSVWLQEVLLRNMGGPCRETIEEPPDFTPSIVQRPLDLRRLIAPHPLKINCGNLGARG